MPELFVSTKLVRGVANEAPNLYINMPYHNYPGHIVDAQVHLDRICQRMKPLGVSINHSLARIAIDLHDAGFQDDHSALGHDAKEDYSAVIAADLLGSLGASTDIIEAVQRAILATHYSAIAATNDEKAVRMADIGNVFGDKNIFLRNFLLLTQEAISMGVPLPETFDAQCLRSKTFLEGYLLDPIVFEADNGTKVPFEPEFGCAERNLATLGRMTMKTALKLIPNTDSFFPCKWLHHDHEQSKAD